MTMVTVNEVFTEYCQENHLPPPSGYDLKNAGQMIGFHFRRFWGPKQPAEIIDQAGFKLTIEDDLPILVLAYPYQFKTEMIKRIEVFLQQKAERIAKNIDEKPPTSLPQKETKIRTRKPIQKPAYSGNYKKII